MPQLCPGRWDGVCPGSNHSGRTHAIYGKNSAEDGVAVSEHVTNHDASGEPTRRDFLYLVTGMTGAVGAAAVAWPFIDQMRPDASTLALASIEVNVAAVEPGMSLTVKWRGKPIFIRNRTEKEIDEAKAVALGDLKDPVARNANIAVDAQATDVDRSAGEGKENWIVMIGSCTHLGCVPLGQAGDFGGWFCPCHGSHYDTAGRIHRIRGQIFMSGHSSYQPSTGIERWIDSRLPLPRLIYDSFVAYPVPRNLNYAYTFGAMLSVMLIVQILTGVVLAMHYAAETTVAFNSVEKIMRDVNHGWLLRYMHANGASFFFIAVYLHIARGLYYGSYKAPREILWILGCVIYLLMMATGFMGYVLPWGQMSFWGATVITGFFTAFPLIGEWIQQFLLGGFAVDNPTLNRFFALHYLLPFMIAGVVILHVWALHVTGQTNPTGVEVKSKTDTVPFTPYATLKDALGVSVFLIAYAWFIFYMPNFLGHPDNYIMANPLSTPAHIVPEWYYLPFYAMLRAITFNVGPIDSKLGGVLVMFGAIIVLFFLPWLDTSKVRSAVYRPWYKLFFWIFVVNAILLGWLGSRPAEGLYVVMSQIGTLYYFGFFLVIMPILGLVETPRRIPNSITEAVLEKNAAKKGAAPAAAQI
ncbi:hypothetical protein Lal_00010457 [Lupinus albus]|nr:hypothetical protein Lal_00010457 [Lupinus albus]